MQKIFYILLCTYAHGSISQRIPGIGVAGCRIQGLGLVSPNLGNEGDKEYINDFLNLNKYTFPVLFDDNASLVYQYGIQAFPSTFIIDKEGYIYQYVPGAMNKLTMKSLIDKAK